MATEPLSPGRPATKAPPKPRRPGKRHHQRKAVRAPFLHAHPVAKPGLKGA